VRFIITLTDSVSSFREIFVRTKIIIKITKLKESFFCELDSTVRCVFALHSDQDNLIEVFYLVTFNSHSRLKF